MRKSLTPFVLVALVVSCVSLAGCGRRRAQNQTVSEAPSSAAVASATGDDGAAGQSRATEPSPHPTPTPKPTPAPAPEVEPTAPTGEVAATCTVHFDLDKDFLKAGEQQKLDRAMRKVAVDRVAAVSVAGHCCELGTFEYNDSLGQRRAEAVQGYLESKYGLGATLFTLQSWGKRKPVASNTDDAGRSKNRRAELTVRY